MSKITVEEFNARVEAANLNGLAIVHFQSEKDLAEEFLRLSLMGLFLVPTDFKDDMPPMCRMVRTRVAGNPDLLSWNYVIPVEHMKP